MNGKYYASDNFEDDRINIRTYIYYLSLDVFVFFPGKKYISTFNPYWIKLGASEELVNYPVVNTITCKHNPPGRSIIQMIRDMWSDERT